MKRCVQFMFVILLGVMLSSALAVNKRPVLSEYTKTSQGLMVRVLVRYDGPELSPYIQRDQAGIRLKEQNQLLVRNAIQSILGRVNYEYRNINVISATIPVKNLSQLSAMRGIVEVTKDRIWEPLIDPASSVADKRAWAKQRVDELSQKSRARYADPSSIRNNAASIIPYRMEYLQQTRESRENKVDRVIPVRGDTLKPLGDGDVKPLLTAHHINPDNYMFYNIDTTHATAIWDDTERGKGIIVGLIDSGTYSGHPLLSGTVIGSEVAPGLSAIEADFDLNGDGHPDGITPDAVSILNNPHGTGTACMIAGHGAITFPANDRYLQAIEAHAPATVVDNGDGTKDVLLFGSAPGASIYAIKVFPWFGGGTPSSIILAAMDRAITLKDRFNNGQGGVNLQVVNMSLGGPDLFPGFSVEDKLADAMVTVGIQPVISAGNAGPAPYTVSEPGGSLKAITVGAAEEPRHNRIAFEFSFPQLAVGDGAKMVPSNRTQIVDFSSRGPLASGYLKPDVVAEGANVMTGWLFDTNNDGLNDLADVAIVGGTSFSAPTTAGGVALLTKFGQVHGLPMAGQAIKAALMNTARLLNGMQAHQQGKGFVDFGAAADYWLANPGIIAGRLNKQKGKFYGDTPLLFADFGSVSYMLGSTDPLDPGEQSDWLIPMETSSADEPFIQYFKVIGDNKQRVQPFPAVVRDIFDPDPTDGLPPFAALMQNTEVYYADGINTGFSDGDYLVSSLNQVDTSVFYSPTTPAGLVVWYPGWFPGLTLGADGYLTDTSGIPLTNGPSQYGLLNSHQQMGAGNYADYDRLTFLGDVTNEPINPVRAFFLMIQFRRSFYGLTNGTPSLTGTISQNQVKEYTLNLPSPIDFYTFNTSFDMGWNNYKFAPPWLGEVPWGSKRKVADIDMIVESPSGKILNVDGFPGLTQGASLNDVESISDFAVGEAGTYKITLIGYDVKGVPNNRANWALRIWDGLVPIIP